jgi:hypothetical protein
MIGPRLEIALSNAALRDEGDTPPVTAASASTAIVDSSAVGESCARAPPPTKTGARGARSTLLAATECDRPADPLADACGDRCGLTAADAVEHVQL